MGWVNPWVVLGWVGSVSGWVGLGRVTQIGPVDNSELNIKCTTNRSSKISALQSTHMQ